MKIVLLFITVYISLFADKFSEGVELYESKSYEKAYIKFLESSTLKDPNPRGYFYLADLLRSGKGTGTKNIKESFDWYIKAADNGIIKAQIIVGTSYASGIKSIVKKNEKKMKHYLSLAYSNGDVESAYTLGIFYGSQKKDLNQALEWFIKASLNDHYLSQYYAASIFFNQKKYDQAFKLMESAAIHKVIYAYEPLSKMYEDGYGTLINFEKSKFFHKKAEKSKNLQYTYKYK